MEEQEVYREMQQLQQQMQQMQQHIEQLEERLSEAQELKKSMEDFQGLEGGEEILVPVSNGIFARAELKEAEELKVNIGSGVVVTKTVEETQGLVDDQVVQLKKIREESQDQYDQLVSRAEKLAQRLRG